MNAGQLTCRSRMPFGHLKSMLMFDSKLPLLRIPARVLLGILASFAMEAQSESRYGVMNLQNDLFVGRDGGGYTNGAFLASVRVSSDADSPLHTPALLSFVAPWLGAGKASLVSFSAGQIIVTPRDLRRSAPDPEDAPYVGGLAFRAAQIEIRKNRSDLVALSLGVIGPAAGAEQTQKAIHSVINAETPMGWDTQVSNRALVALERSIAWRLASSDRPGASQRSGDMILQTGATLGNLETLAGASVLLRYGIGLEQSFPTTMSITGRSGDPFLFGEGWFVFGGVSGEHVFHHIGIGESSALRKSRAALVVGLSFGWRDGALTFALKSADPLIASSSRRQSFGSLTYVLPLR